jgi:hypothetical protein
MAVFVVDDVGIELEFEIEAGVVVDANADAVADGEAEAAAKRGGSSILEKNISQLALHTGLVAYEQVLHAHIAFACLLMLLLIELLFELLVVLLMFDLMICDCRLSGRLVLGSISMTS